MTFPGAGPVRPVRGVSFALEPRRGGRRRRGVGLGQVADRARGRPAHRGAGPGRRAGAAALPRAPTCSRGTSAGRSATSSAPSLSMVVPGPDDLVQPHPAGRRAARRGRPPPPGHDRGEARGPRRRPAARRPRSRSRSGAPASIPHEFSGGMRQRAMIGMGLMGSPALIIADEPTTALDVTVQQQVLELLESIREADDGSALAAHQPRRRRGPAGLRPGAGHVRRADRGGPARRRACDRAPGTRTPGPSSPRSRTWTPTSTAAGRHPGPPGGPVATCPPGAPTPPAARSPTHQLPWPRTRARGRRAGRRVACWHAGTSTGRLAAPTIREPSGRLDGGGAA